MISLLAVQGSLCFWHAHSPLRSGQSLSHFLLPQSGSRSKETVTEMAGTSQADLASHPRTSDKSAGPVGLWNGALWQCRLVACASIVVKPNKVYEKKAQEELSRLTKP